MTRIGTQCYYVDDVIFSDGRRCKKFILGKLNGFILRYLPLFSVWFEYIMHRGTISKLIMLAREKNIDLIHPNNQLVLNYISVFIAKSLSIPCVSHLRTFNSYGLNKNKVDYLKKVNIRYVAISEKIKCHWVEKGLDSKKIDVIYNVYQPCNDNAFPENDISSMSTYDGYKILFVGRLIECKGIPFLIESFRRVLKNNINARLFLVGDGVEVDRIRENISFLNIEPYVFFLGYQENPRSFMSIADLLVLPPKEEGFGRVLLEAMGAGTPVIGTNIGGIPEIIEHGTNGLLVDHGDIEALKNSIIKILKNNSLREEIIQGGYETINSKFCIETYQEKLENIYDTLLGVTN